MFEKRNPIVTNRDILRFLSSGIRTSYQYRLWISDVLTKDNFTCIKCGNKENLEVHHIKSLLSIFEQYKIETPREAFRCPETFNINNGITLCKECHKKIHKAIREGREYTVEEIDEKPSYYIKSLLKIFQ